MLDRPVRLAAILAQMQNCSADFFANVTTPVTLWGCFVTVPALLDLSQPLNPQDRSWSLLVDYVLAQSLDLQMRNEQRAGGKALQVAYLRLQDLKMQCQLTPGD